MCVCVCVCVCPGSTNYSMLAVFKKKTNDTLGAHDLFKGSTESNPLMTNLDSILKSRDTFESFLMRWMKLEPIIQSEVSQKDKDHYNILTHIYGI